MEGTGYGFLAGGEILPGSPLARGWDRETEVRPGQSGRHAADLTFGDCMTYAGARPYEEMGVPAAVRRHHGRVIELWEDADAELQRRVVEARRTLVRLEAPGS